MGEAGVTKGGGGSLAMSGQGNGCDSSGMGSGLSDRTHATGGLGWATGDSDPNSRNVTVGIGCSSQGAGSGGIEGCKGGTRASNLTGSSISNAAVMHVTAGIDTALPPGRLKAFLSGTNNRLSGMGGRRRGGARLGSSKGGVQA